MARGINKVILIGNLGHDPEVKKFDNGDIITRINVATSESWIDKTTGDKRDKTEWHRVVFNKGLAVIAKDYLFKGSKVYIEGKLTTKKWQDKTGQDRYTTEIMANILEMLGDTSKEQKQTKTTDENLQTKNIESKDYFNDEIPF